MRSSALGYDGEGWWRSLGAAATRAALIALYALIVERTRAGSEVDR